MSERVQGGAFTDALVAAKGSLPPGSTHKGKCVTFSQPLSQVTALRTDLPLLAHLGRG